MHDEKAFIASDKYASVMIDCSHSVEVESLGIRFIVFVLSHVHTVVFS